MKWITDNNFSLKGQAWVKNHDHKIMDEMEGKRQTS